MQQLEQCWACSEQAAVAAVARTVTTQRVCATSSLPGTARRTAVVSQLVDSGCFMSQTARKDFHWATFLSLYVPVVSKRLTTIIPVQNTEFESIQIL